jgi:hypothetical protein
MNPYRNERGGVYMRRGHTDELDETKLQGIIESLQRVASATDTTLDQAIKVYECATRNRLAEVLLDSGDSFDEVVEEIKKWKQSGNAIRVMLSGDDLADEMRVKIMSD